MAQRIIRNDFVAGEISPELWGRHDVEMYYHGAAKIQNFIPRRTGGLRKRAGTILQWHLHWGEGCEYRVIPFLHDKDAYGLLALFREPGQNKPVRVQFMIRRPDGTTMSVGPRQVSILASLGEGELSKLKYIQIGDTLFFSLRGHPAVKCAVTFAGPDLAWSPVSPTQQPVRAPRINATAVNFKTGDAYKDATRTYQLWGVKDGVLSPPSQTVANITLAWVSGAYVDVTFDPDWTHHQYYILGKLQGGQYGEVTRFYPDQITGARSDTEWSFNSQDGWSQSRPIGDATYTVAYDDPSNIASAWSSAKITADTKTENGNSRTGAFVQRLKCHYTKKPSAPILAVQLWVGALAQRSATGEATTNGERAGIGAQITVTLRQSTGEEQWQNISSWQISGQYSDSCHTLSVLQPATPQNNGRYQLLFTDAETGDPVHVALRGAILCTDSATRTFHDDNIQPGTLTGEQEALKVGEPNMYVDLISTWQQRLIAAGSDSLPFSMWFSRIGDLYNFHTYRPQTSDDAFEATMAVTRATRILHVVAEKWLLLFTDSGEYMVGSTNGALAYNTVDIKKLSGIGAHGDIPPISTEGEVLFVAQDVRSVYKLDYTLERDSVVPTNLSVRAEHVTALHGIVATAYQRYPDSVLWCLLDDGSLASLTFFPEESVCAWARHTLSGGGGMKCVDIISTGSIRTDDEYATTSDVFLVFTHPDKPGDIWIERLRPNVIVDIPVMQTARCRDHMGYTTEHFPVAGKDPVGDVEASLETLRMETHEMDTMGAMNAQFGGTLRVLRSGKVAVRPLPEDGGTHAEWRSNRTQSAHVPLAAGGKVKLARADIRIAPQVMWNREARFEIKSDDEWPCDILALCVRGNFGTMRDGG